MDFKDKTVIVTGAARGIGRVIAERFARLGAAVVVNDLDQEAVDSVARELGGQAIGIRADVTSTAEVKDLFDKTLERFGRIDVLVNNAGVTRDGLLVRMDEKDWDMVLDINLKGAFLTTRAAAKFMMKQRSGRIINISSVVGLIGNAGQVNYSASKAGLIGLTKSSARELASRGVTINAVAPGFIETEMTRKLSESARENLISQITLNRLGTPDDIASAVLFLASDDASYITGQVLAVDGGITM
ncbi:MAG: 3-oxoacyl-[acyl-carrier-protein] reductase [candidate division Zixibacteria bacterium]|nr:3-oxoacyl-[acyl-carrier-protein] reductase [candidate division Zixibacteria bacterium]